MRNGPARTTAAAEKPAVSEQGLDCLLERYTITTSGRLIHHTVRYEDVPEEQPPYPDMPFIGSIRSVPAGDVDTNFGKTVEFYTLRQRHAGVVVLRSQIH